MYEGIKFVSDLSHVLAESIGTCCHSSHIVAGYRLPVTAPLPHRKLYQGDICYFLALISRRSVKIPRNGKKSNVSPTLEKSCLLFPKLLSRPPRFFLLPCAWDSHCSLFLLYYIKHCNWILMFIKMRIMFNLVSYPSIMSAEYQIDPFYREYTFSNAFNFNLFYDF